MFQYSPPKKALWGHSLGKMPTARAKSLFDEFLSQATRDHKFMSADLMILESLPGLVSQFENLLGMPVQGQDPKQFSNLSESQGEQCVNGIVKYEASSNVPSSRSPFWFSESIAIPKWHIKGQDVRAGSWCTIHYGRSPRFSTAFYFETVEHFQAIKQLLKSLQFCELNEKYLTVARIPKKKS